MTTEEDAIKQIGKELYYRRVLAVQEVYQEHKEEGITNRYIFRKYIRDVFFIGEWTFYKYLRTNAKKELTNIENLKKELEKCEPSE